ncbi:MAG: hypothetical protein Q7S19_02230 [bacterium]|nr:hypothetical protein [bacterium]
MSTEHLSAITARVETLQKAGKSAEVDKLLVGVLTELEKISTSPTFKVNMGSIFERDFRKEGYDLNEDVEPLTGDAEFEALSFLEGKETSIDGDKMRERALKLKANRGQRDAQIVLKFLNSAEGKEASKALRDFYLVFPGTVWVNRDSRHHCVPVLSWDGLRWVLGLSGLGYGWSADDRLLGSRN